MQQHYKQLYLMATRHNDFIAHKAISNYLSTKQKNQFSCEALLDVGKSLKEVKLTFDGNKEDKQKKKNLKLVQMVGARNNKGNARKSKGSPSKDKNRQSSCNITIIENDENHQQVNPQVQKTKFIDSSQSHNFPLQHQLHLKQSQLDTYIDQYLYEIVNGNNQLLREQLQSDRRGFIEKAIRKIKENIMKEGQNDILDEIRNKNGNRKVSETVIERKQGGRQFFERKLGHGESTNITRAKRVERENRSFQANKSLEKDQKRHFSFVRSSFKSKSTCTIPLPTQKHLPTISNCTLSNSSSTISYPMAQRSIYNSTTPSSQFIQRVGQTFYTNEVKMLNKITELEMKNRQRANRCFRRRLVSLEKGGKVGGEGQRIGEYY